MRNTALSFVHHLAGGLLALALLAPGNAAARESDSIDLTSGSFPMWLRLRGGYRTAAGVQEWVADATLVMSLDAWARSPTQAVVPHAWAHEVPEGAPVDTSSTPTAGDADKREGSGGPEPSREGPSEKEQARGSSEVEDSRAPPRVRLTSDIARATVRAALDSAGVKATARQLDDVLSRARVSALLPELRVRVGRNLDESLRFAPTNDDPAYYTTTGAADWRFEVRVTWELHRLVYAKEELAAERYRRQDRERAHDRARDTLEALFDWQRGSMEESDPDLLAEDRLAGKLRRLQAAIRLDVLTNGWFSRHLADRERLSRTRRSQASRPSRRKKRKNGLAGGAPRE